MAEPILETVRRSLANGTISDGDVHELVKETERLRSGIQDVLDGNYPNPRAHRPGQCAHGVWYYDTCENCIDEWLQALIGPVKDIANG